MKLYKTKIINKIEKSYLRKDIPNIEVRRIFQGIGVEKVYLINSPRITNIKIQRKSKVKKAKLYYLREKIGKATRLKQKFVL